MKLFVDGNRLDHIEVEIDHTRSDQSITADVPVIAMRMVPVNNDSKFSRYGEVSDKTALEGRGPAGLRLATAKTELCAEPLDPAKEKSALESLEGGYSIGLLGAKKAILAKANPAQAPIAGCRAAVDFFDGFSRPVANVSRAMLYTG
jgi:hypothetical protein